MSRDSFIFYRSFYEALKDLPRDVQGEIYTAIMEYSLNGRETENLKPIAKAVFILVKPQLDANNQRFENGKKGGRPRKETKPKPKDNQVETKPKPNENVNVNVNENVDVLLEKEPKEKKIRADDVQDQIKPETEERKKVAPKKEKFGVAEFRAALLEEGAEEMHVNDWIKVRQSKRAPMTETALETMLRECRKNNYPVADAVRVCAERSWQGFKYNWIKNETNGQSNHQSGRNGAGKISGTKLLLDNPDYFEFT